jgi:NAD(P)-dependent dehydrogenase (short-subunit alcohol dehydrogenase family)
VVITGGASGIGRALADRFAAEGSKIVLADVEPNALEEAAAELGAGGAAVLAMPTDVTKPEQVQALCDRTLAEFDRVDVVCNNAGVSRDSTVLKLRWRDVFLNHPLRRVREWASHEVEAGEAAAAEWQREEEERDPD